MKFVKEKLLFEREKQCIETSIRMLYINLLKLIHVLFEIQLIAGKGKLRLWLPKILYPFFKY